MKGFDPAIMKLIEVLTEHSTELPMSVENAAVQVCLEMEEYDHPDYQCPLCGQAKGRPATEIFHAMKSCEVWSADGGSWTFLNSSYEGDLEAMLEDMLKVIRGEVT